MDCILKASGISHMIVRHPWLVLIVALKLNVSCESVGRFCSLQQSINLICVHTADVDVQTLPPLVFARGGGYCGMSVRPLFLFNSVMTCSKRLDIQYRTPF